VARPIGEPDNLVLEGGTVTRPRRTDRSVEQWRAAQVVTDDSMHASIRASQEAVDLRLIDPIGEERERHRLRITRLWRQSIEVQGSTAQPGRGAGLQPPHPEAEPGERRRKPRRGRLSDPPAVMRLRTDMDAAAQERTGGQNDRPAGDLASVLERQPDDAPVAARRRLRADLRREPLHDRETVLPFDGPTHPGGVQLAVGLRPRAANRRASAPVEQPELDPRRVDRPTHLPAQRVDLADEMAFAKSTDRGIARHPSNRRSLSGNQPNPTPHPSSSQRSLTTSMTSADHNEVVLH